LRVFFCQIPLYQRRGSLSMSAFSNLYPNANFTLTRRRRFRDGRRFGRRGEPGRRSVPAADPEQASAVPFLPQVVRTLVAFAVPVVVPKPGRPGGLVSRGIGMVRTAAGMSSSRMAAAVSAFGPAAEQRADPFVEIGEKREQIIKQSSECGRPCGGGRDGSGSGSGDGLREGSRQDQKECQREIFDP